MQNGICKRAYAKPENHHILQSTIPCYLHICKRALPLKLTGKYTTELSIVACTIKLNGLAKHISLYHWIVNIPTDITKKFYIATNKKLNKNTPYIV